MRSKPQMLSLSIAIDMADYVRAETKCKDFGVDIAVVIVNNEVRFVVLDQTAPGAAEAGTIIVSELASKLSLINVTQIVNGGIQKVTAGEYPTDGERV